MTTRASIGIYVHIPFCRRRCDFCAFYLELYRDNRAASFIDALRREIRLYRSQGLLNHHQVQSIYFGGGTPTTIRTGQLTSLLEDIRQSWIVSPDAELSIEAHPATVSQGDLVELVRAGFNRISLGAESMEDQEFIPIGRPGRVRDTMRAVRMARGAGFMNINLDLMYGLPGQTLDSWRRSLDRLLQLAPTHVACYALTIEEGTTLAHNIARRVSPAPDDSLQIEMDAIGQGLLEQAGYRRYEISNYAKPGYACRHNLLYWTNGSYLGLGPSAQSYVEGRRFGNVPDLGAYKRALREEHLPVEEIRELTSSEQARDAVIFGLRLVEGIASDSLEAHAQRYGHRETLLGLRAQNLIEEVGSRTRLTQKGRQYADGVAEKLY